MKTLHIEFTTACNSRCVMCDYWKTGSAGTIDPEIVLTSVSEHLPLGLRTVYFTGGECLLYAQKLFSLCGQIKEQCPELTLGLITNGLLLEQYAKEVASCFSKVIISLDSTDPEVYKAIRGVDGLPKIKNGVRLLRSHAPEIRLNLRVLVLEANTHGLPDIVAFGIQENINRISFIPEDTSSAGTFGRTEDVFSKKAHHADLSQLRSVIRSIRNNYFAYLGNMLRPGLEDLERIYQLYLGCAADRPPCDKPYQSCVVGTSGTVSPCFFIRGSQQISGSKTLGDILSSKEYRACIEEIAAGRQSACLTCACPKILS